MKKKIAIMISIILMARTFTACTAEETMDNSSLSPTVSTSVGVSHLGKVLKWQQPKQQPPPKKPPFQKKQSLRDRIQKPKKKADSGQKSAVVSATDPIQKT